MSYCIREGEVLVSGRRRFWKGCFERRRVMPLALFLACLVFGPGVWAQIPIVDIISAGVKKVIVAADLKIQQLETETIELQNAQKALENSMQAAELADISDWVGQQRDLFAGFYQELWQVKTALATFEQVRTMIDRQAQIVSGYKQVYAVIGQDRHFSADELRHLYAVLSGILKQSADNLSRLSMAVKALVTQMSDAGRLRIIEETGRSIDRNYSDLAEFSQQSFLLSVQRSRSLGDVAVTKALYGID